MKHTLTTPMSFLFLISLLNTQVHAHGDGLQSAGRADSHAPIGVMGDHIHKKGELMVSFRHMTMSMSGNLQGRDSIDDDTIATSIPNRFAAMEGMPPTLRIVPQEMDSSMQMLGLMYAPSDQVTLMLMANYLQKDMQLTTYQGGMGTAVRGTFNTSSSGFGDTKIAALISLHQSHTHKLHFNLGFSLPTGATDQSGQVLTPASDMLMDMRLPYAMQLGSGSYDFEPALTYTGRSSSLSWGTQLRSTLRLNENDEGYKLGDEYGLSAWGQYLFVPAVSASVRLSAKSSDAIEGIDAQIMGPVQSADPSNYGGDYADLGLGINFLGQEGALKHHRVALEYRIPLLQDVNGVQMEMQNMLSVGYQYAF